MVTKRSIPMCIIYTIITCGIYVIYWFIVMTNESNELAPEVECASGGVAFLLSIITCNIYGLYWAYKMGEKLDNAKNARGMYSGNGGILYLVLCLFGLGIIAYALMQSDLNALAEEKFI